MPKKFKPDEPPAYPAYQRLKRQLAELPGLTFTWPRPGEIRVRTIIHRGAQRPTFKYHSITQQRVLHSESLLEQEALWRLDACPYVTFISEQPVRICCTQQTGFTHIPDFLALADGAWQIIEIKRSSTVTADIMERTERLTALLEPVARYRLVTEFNLNDEVVGANCKKLLCRGRSAPSAEWQDRVIAGVRYKGHVKLSEYGWGTSQSSAAEGIAWLLLKGRLVADLSVELCGDTLVRLPLLNERPGGVLWPA